MPVILIVYDAVEGCAYWLYVQQYLLMTTIDLETNQTWVTLRLSKQNVLNEAAVERFRKYKSNLRQSIFQGGNIHEQNLE